MRLILSQGSSLFESWNSRKLLEFVIEFVVCSIITRTLQVACGVHRQDKIGRFFAFANPNLRATGYRNIVRPILTHCLLDFYWLILTRQQSFIESWCMDNLLHELTHLWSNSSECKLPRMTLHDVHPRPWKVGCLCLLLWFKALEQANDISELLSMWYSFQ